MFRLKLTTDPRWVNIVESNIPEILTDHAYCEQKAASNAISIAIKYPEYSRLVSEMIRLAQEELEHFNRVHDIILSRGWVLGKERKDEYANLMYNFMKRGGDRKTQLMERLLFAALIEARSCERFRVLSENIKDPELAEFYRELMTSEANHYALFIEFAREIFNKEIVDARWQEYLDYEGQVIKQFGVKETMHG